jgi:hypothetical protein
MMIHRGEIMTYKDTINSIIHKIPETIVDLGIPRERGIAPTQAFSEFLTNREQGDWAERLVFQAINGMSKNFIAVQYGKSDNKVAGEPGFTEFYESYQDELDSIGKRPDLLVFRVSDYDKSWGGSIANLERDKLDVIVPKAVAGLEIRSSSFLIDKYDQFMRERFETNLKKALTIKSQLLAEYIDVFEQPKKSQWKEILAGITSETISNIDFSVPGWRANQRVSEANELLKELKSCIREVQKRDFLSITPKVEDIKVVYKWIETYGVPHFYFQVFFDKVYGISFEHILRLVSDPLREGIDYYVESGDAKNQNKTTVKINSKIGENIAAKVDMPEHISEKKELPRGRLLFHVSFKGGKAYLNIESLCKLLEIDSSHF